MTPLSLLVRHQLDLRLQRLPKAYFTRNTTHMAYRLRCPEYGVGIREQVALGLGGASRLTGVLVLQRAEFRDLVGTVGATQS